MISYVRFWETLKAKNISQYSLINKHGISTSTLHKMRKGEYLGLRKIEDFCRIIDCDIQDIVTYIPDKESKE